MGILNKIEKWGNSYGNINIYSDLNKSDIPKILTEKNIWALQLYQFKNPNKQTWEVLNEFFGKHPEIGLRVVWGDNQDLVFYKEIPNIRNFTISSYNTKDYSMLLSNTELKHLSIGETKSTAVDLSFIKELKRLESLYVDGMKKGLNNVKHLNKLNSLTFRGVKLDNLDFLSDMNNLQELHILYGSYKNLDSVSRLKRLKSIEFSRVRQIPNFDFLNSLENLEKIEFEGMSRMDEIPNLFNLRKLKSIHISNNLRLKNIKSVGQIPNLKFFYLSFPENSKTSERKNLIEQSVEILMKSKSIEYTNLMHFTGEEVMKKLTKKGIKTWRWDTEI
mgnify:CR=1 FL=1